jgi:predicted porin
MNKKLIALAVAGACVAPAAMAQTANPVTLYGRIYVTFENVEAKGGSTPVASRNRVSDQSSLLGVRGTEDLGGGLKAVFQLETGFRADSNVGVGNLCTVSGTVCQTGNGGNAGLAAFNRNSGVGLQGGWGTVMLGRWDTPFKTMTTNIDPYGDLTIGGITSAINDRTNFDRREQNSLMYWSPKMGGFELRAFYSANEFKSTTANPYSQGVGVMYTGGPLYAFLVYEEHNNQSGLGSNFGTTTAGVNEKGTSGGGYYSFGPLRVGALYQEITKTNTQKQKGWMGNLVWTLGNHQFSYQYQDVKDGGLSTASLQPKCDVNTVGWQYNFTKRTFTLLQYTQTKNNDAATCNFGANTLGIAAGQDPQGYSLGIRHVF